MILTYEQMFARMNGSATLKALVGTDGNADVNAYPDWPEEEWDGADSRIVYTQPYGASNGGALHEAGVQLDVFVPRDTGMEIAGDIETELKALFHEKWWIDSYSGQRVYTLMVNESARPSSYEEPIHWMFEVAVAAST